MSSPGLYVGIVSMPSFSCACEVRLDAADHLNELGHGRWYFASAAIISLWTLRDAAPKYDPALQPLRSHDLCGMPLPKKVAPSV